MRALTVVRLSMARDASTSPERQREHCHNTIVQRGWTEVGVAEDLAVSATKFSPFNRPELGQWLNSRKDEFDVLICWRLDRLVRSSLDLANLITWADQNEKSIVSASEGFDLSTPFGKAMATIIGALGQLEAETVRLRVSDAHRNLRGTDRWASGVPPLGYRVCDHPSGKGKGLETDSGAKALLHKMAGWLLSGKSLTWITAELNERGELSAMDRTRVANGKPRRDWTASNVKRVLTSPATQGFKITGQPGKMILDSDGEPIQMAPPTFDTETWEQIQTAIAARSANGKRRTHSDNPVLGIAFCGHCGRSMAQQVTVGRNGNRWVYARCSRTPRNCKGTSLSMETLLLLVEEEFLSRKGDSPVVEQRFIPGTDNRAEIERTKGSLARLKAESDAGLVTDQGEYISRLTALSERLKQLELDPYAASRWEPVETDKTYREVWETADVDTARKLLVDAGVYVLIWSGNPLSFEMLEGLEPGQRPTVPPMARGRVS